MEITIYRKINKIYSLFGENKKDNIIYSSPTKYLQDEQSEVS